MVETAVACVLVMGQVSDRCGFSFMPDGRLSLTILEVPLSPPFLLHEEVSCVIFENHIRIIGQSEMVLFTVLTYSKCSLSFFSALGQSCVLQI